MASSSSPFRLGSVQTALAVLVPSHLQPEINALRSIHDKAYRKWQPHINILYPFVDPSYLSSAVDILREALKNEEPCPITFQGAGVFRHRKNATVFLKPSERSLDSLVSLRRVLVQSLGRSEKEGAHDGVFNPHLTMGQAAFQGDHIDKLAEKVEKLAEIQWDCASLVVMQRQSSGAMKIVDELSIGEKNSNKDDTHQNQTNDESVWRQCFAYSSAAEKWSQMLSATTTEPPQGLATVAIASYNLMADSYGPSCASRMPYLIDAIASAFKKMTASAKVLCLQEVTEESLPLLLSNDFIQGAYPYSTHSPSSLLTNERNLVTLATRPFRHFTLQFSERHKSTLVIRLDSPAIKVANVHLTSGLTNDTVKIKRAQLEKASEFLGLPEQKDVILAGDFNLTTSSDTIQTALSKGVITVETAKNFGDIIDPNLWEDAFLLCGDLSDNAPRPEELFDGEEGATFDRTTNCLAAIPNPNVIPIDNRPQRYDRILFPKEAPVQIKHFERFGFPSEDGTCPSDHWGIWATLQIEAKTDDDEVSRESASRTEDPIVQETADIQLVQDETDLLPYLDQYIPSASDQAKRQNALSLLHQTLTSDEKLSQTILAPLGSYAMGTYMSDSDMDILAIGNVSPREFFDAALAQLKTLNHGIKDKEDGLKSLHFINSLVPVIETEVKGIKIDLQYCQAPEVVLRYHATRPAPELRALVFDRTLISTLSPSSLRPLNTYRDTAYLINTLPDLSSYRTAHRFLSIYLKRRGLYSAKYGYLGGIHLSLMLSRVVQLLAAQQQAPTNVTQQPNPSEGEGVERPPITPASLVRSFFTYYSTFNWAEEMVSVPSPEQLGNRPPQTRRTAREPVYIQSIHVPTARPNVASSCTRLSAQVFGQEFSLAAEKLAQEEWAWCHRPVDETVKDFLQSFGAFVKIGLVMWDLPDMGRDKVRELIGTLESRMPGLMVALSKLNGVEGRVWPGRFCISIEREKGEDERSERRGYYLVGVSAKSDGYDEAHKKLLTSKLIDSVRVFERNVRDSGVFDGGNIWIDAELVPQKKVLGMGFVLDRSDWAKVDDAEGHTKSEELDTEEKECQALDIPSSSKASLPLRRSRSAGLRPAQDVIARIKWDSSYSPDDFVIGYEDRFIGVKEVEFSKWKTEQTDMEFIPMHRIVWIRRKSADGEKVWDRKAKVDKIFAGSGR